MRAAVPLREPEAAVEVPTIEQCDQVLRRYGCELRQADGDQEKQALVRYEIDRWLDLRLAIMRSRDARA